MLALSFIPLYTVNYPFELHCPAMGPLRRVANYFKQVNIRVISYLLTVFGVNIKKYALGTLLAQLYIQIWIQACIGEVLGSG